MAFGQEGVGRGEVEGRVVGGVVRDGDDCLEGGGVSWVD